MADQVHEDSHTSNMGKSKISRFLRTLDRQKLTVLTTSSAGDKEQEEFSTPTDAGRSGAVTQ